MRNSTPKKRSYSNVSDGMAKLCAWVALMLSSAPRNAASWPAYEQVTLVTRRKAFNRLVASIIGITMQEKSKSKGRQSLKNARTSAFNAQGGKCYYCNQPMWLKSVQELLSRFSISPKQARLLQCTGEHLEAHSEGGSSSQKNIVAACWFCNTKRNAGKKNRAPDQHKNHVTHRLLRGASHGLILSG